MAYCSECGEPLVDGTLFCASCGHEVSGAASPAAGAASIAAPAVAQANVVAKAVSEMVMHEVQAPVSAGESVISTWAGADRSFAATRAAGAARQAAQGLTGETSKFVSHKATGRSSSQSGAAMPAAKKSKLPVVLVAAGAVVLVAAFALYVVPLFIPHPYDPNSHVALTSDSSSSASGSSASSASSSEGSSESSSSSSNGSTSPSASVSSSSSSESSSSSTSDGSSTATGSYSTDERPMIDEFNWLDGEAMKGNMPADAKRIVDFGALTGGWKCYIVGNMEWLANADIEAGQEGAIIAIDWYYLRVTSDDVREDTTPTSSFAGSFDGGMLDATGSGRVTIAAFWEKDGYQYATGSFIWPSGETSTIALVRP